MTNTTAIVDASSNKENKLLCPSPFRNVLNPNGLIAKMIKPARMEVSIAISLNNLCFSSDVQSVEGDLLANIEY
jgi:hypothetical protein